MARMYNDSLWLLVWNPIHGWKNPALLCSQASFFLQCVFQTGLFYEWSVGEISCSPGCVLKALFSPARAGHRNKSWSYHTPPFEGKVGCLAALSPLKFFFRAFSVYERWWTRKSNAQEVPGRGTAWVMPLFQQCTSAPGERVCESPPVATASWKRFRRFYQSYFLKDEADSAPASYRKGEHFSGSSFSSPGGKNACSYMALANTE